MVNRRFFVLKRISESDRSSQDICHQLEMKILYKKTIHVGNCTTEVLEIFSQLCGVDPGFFQPMGPRAPTPGVPTTTPGLQKENECMEGPKNDAIFDECFKPSFLVSMVDVGGVNQQKCFK